MIRNIFPCFHHWATFRVCSPQRGGRAALLAMLLLLGAVSVSLAADSTNSPVAVAAGKRTVGLEIVKKTINADQTAGLTFRWSEKGVASERTVVVNDQTIVVYNGQIRKFSDLTDAEMHAKAVATVGADGVTTVLLRFGKSPVPKDKLTPEQAALLATLAPSPSSASEAALDKRVAALVAALDLKAPASERVSAVITADLRAVRDAHNAGLQLDPSVHARFIAGLQADLTPEQIETVKDRLTINKLPITFKVYHQIIPDLKPQDDAKILAWLEEAREQSLDEKNVDEMTPIFKKYKTEIQHYLESQGYDWDKSYRAFVAAQKNQPAKPVVD